MNINVSKEAFSWFLEEMNATNGDYIKFFVRYGGVSSISDSYSLGVSKENPSDVIASCEIDNITFYIEEEDAWYFNGYDLHVKYNVDADEIEYIYKK